MIPRFLTAFIPAAVRARGDGYVGRHVRFARAGADEITALVSGTQGYVVVLRAAEQRFDLSCTCPYALDNGICKHQWAVLRQADAEGKLEPLLKLAGEIDPDDLLRRSPPRRSNQWS